MGAPPRGWPGGAGLLLALALVSLLLAPARAGDPSTLRHSTRITVADVSITNGKDCRVGVFGWDCDPSDLSLFTSVEEEEEVQVEEEVVDTSECGGTDSCGQVIDEFGLVQDQVGESCVTTKYEARRKLLLEGLDLTRTTDAEIFVDLQFGDDAAPGTRAAPWATLGRAQRHIQEQRHANPDGSLKLPHPILLWVHDSNLGSLTDQYHGITYYF